MSKERKRSNPLPSRQTNSTLGPSQTERDDFCNVGHLPNLYGKNVKAIDISEPNRWGRLKELCQLWIEIAESTTVWDLYTLHTCAALLVADLKLIHPSFSDRETFRHPCYTLWLWSADKAYGKVDGLPLTTPPHYFWALERCKKIIGYLTECPVPEMESATMLAIYKLYTRKAGNRE